MEKFQINQAYILNVGTIEPRKNLITLLRAYTKFRNSTKRACQLVIAGGRGWKYESFYQELENHPYKKDIIVNGYVSREDLVVLYSMAQMFVYPLFYEGFDFPVLEAMTCGTPVIISAVSSLPEVGGGLLCILILIQ